MPPPFHRTVAYAATVLLGCLAATSCGIPPELRPPDGTPVPAPTGTHPSATPTAPWTPTPTAGMPSATPSPTGFPDSQAVDCHGTPTGAQVVAVLRRNRSLLPAGIRVTVETGPLCAGNWQYTVVLVPGREPLAVVTRGGSTSLRLVTVGTDVCSAPVRAEAPLGIRTAAACV